MCSLARRKAITEGWYFSCQCRRCLSATELGSHCNTVACAACGAAAVLPTAAADTAEWECGECGRRVAGAAVAETVHTFSERIKQQYETDRSDSLNPVIET